MTIPLGLCVSEALRELTDRFVSLYASQYNRDAYKIRSTEERLRELCTTYEDYLYVSQRLEEIKTTHKHFYLKCAIAGCGRLSQIEEVFPLLPRVWREERRKLIASAGNYAEDKEALKKFLEANDIY